MTDKPMFEPQAYEDALKAEGAIPFTAIRPDGRRETRLFRIDGDDAIAYDFVRGGWERIPGMGRCGFSMEARWRRIEEIN